MVGWLGSEGDECTTGVLGGLMNTVVGVCCNLQAGGAVVLGLHPVSMADVRQRDFTVLPFLQSE